MTRARDSVSVGTIVIAAIVFATVAWLTSTVTSPSRVSAQGGQTVPGPPAARILPTGCSNGQTATFTAATGVWSCSTTIGNEVVGVGAAYKVARAETALDGSNPTSVASGLTTILACTVTIKGTAAPGVGTSVLTGNINGTSFDVYAWKVTSAIDDTLVASTGTESFYTVCIGT